MTAVHVIAGLAALGLLYLAASVQVQKQYERGVQFRLNRVRDLVGGPR